MAIEVDLQHLQQHGWLRVSSAVPRELCEALVDALADELAVPLNEPTAWAQYGEEMGDLLPIWGHQTQWDIRQHPRLHEIWATIWGNEKLHVSLDSCRFTPPWKPGYAEPYGVHWDHEPLHPTIQAFQGVIALTDTEVNQGGFRCVPSLLHDRSAWPKRPTLDADGDYNWLADVANREVVYVPAGTGDLIVWNSHLPHGNSKNQSSKPRLAFYVQMMPADGNARFEEIESWRTGRCVPFWRSRRGYDRIEPWPPATLTPLGQRLLGSEEWP